MRNIINKSKVSFISAFGLIALFTFNLAYAASYSFMVLDTMNARFTNAYDINNDGTIVGDITDNNFGRRAVSWSSQGAVTVLATNGASGTSARAINNHGQIVGSVANQNSEAAIWNNGVLTELGLFGGTSSYATDINDAGQIVGAFNNNINPNKNVNGFILDNGLVYNLFSTTNQNNVASSINNSGQVVGYSLGSGGKTFATLWEDGGVAELTPLQSKNGFGNVANAINDNGQVVGNLNGKATLWDNTYETALELESYEGLNSYAVDINEAGDIVGATVTAQGNHAVIWKDREMIDLNTLVDPATLGLWTLINAYAINDNGDIVGQAYEKSNPRVNFAFVLKLNTENPPPPDISNVPLPASLPLMMTGLGALGVMIRRKK